MSWDYNYQAGPAGSLETLSDYIDGLRVIPDEDAGMRELDLVIPHRPGSDPNVVEFGAVGSLTVSGQLRPTSSAGTITHVNGVAGHIHESLSAIRRLFRATRAPYILQRDIPIDPFGAPTFDTVQLEVRAGRISTGRGRNHLQVEIPLRAAWPYWRSTTQRSTTINGSGNVQVRGDAPIADMVLQFPSAGATLTHTESGDSVQLLSGGGATDVDVGARTILANPGGTDNSSLFIPDKPWWQYWPGGGDVAITTSAAVTILWHDQYG